MAGSRTRDEWADLVAKFGASGERTAAFCAKHGVAPKTFSWWRWRLRSEGMQSALPARGSMRLVAVDVKPSPVTPRGPGAVRIALADFDVQVEVGTDVAYVAALVDALRERC